MSESTLIAIRYRTQRDVGSGGNADVYLATDTHTGKQVAIKVLRKQTQTATARFLREARLIASINSQHVVRVLDVGNLDDESPYIAMEYVHGWDVARLLAKHGPFKIPQAVDLMVQACHGLAAAHARGIVHRDVKPANFVVTRTHTGHLLLKVVDFGISRREKTAAKLTRPGQMVGTPYYMSPEQMKASSNVDHRADLWSTAVVLYEVLSGRRPFEGETLMEVVSSVTSDEPPPLIDLRPDVPRRVHEAIHRSLAKRPDDRYPNLAEFARAIAVSAPAAVQRAAAQVPRNSQPPVA